MKLILKPSKEGLKVLHQIQQATLQAARVISQQLKRNVEIVYDNEVAGLVSPANEREIIHNGKKVNSQGTSQSISLTTS